MADARAVLLDDRSFVEVCRRVVGGSTDELDLRDGVEVDTFVPRRHRRDRGRRGGTPLAWALWYGFEPMKAGRNEWWMLMTRCG